MNLEISTTHNRRTSTRLLEKDGHVVCHTSATSQRYDIKDASSSGIALQHGPPLALGTAVNLSIRWPMIGAATARGEVCRHSARDRGFAVRYTQAEGMAALLQSLSNIDHRRKNDPIPLLCGRHEEINIASDRLDECGHEYQAALSPLNAFWILQDPWIPVTSLVLPPTSQWLDFSVYIGHYYPALQRLLVDASLSPIAMSLATSHALVDDCLDVRAPIAALQTALGLAPRTERCLCCEEPLANNVLPFCAACIERSTNLGPLDDLGRGD